MIDDIGEVLRECYKRGWITTRDGNISVRQKDSNILCITPSSVKKYQIYSDDILVLPIIDGELIKIGNHSGELKLHWLLQKSGNETRAVLHAHPTNTIAAMRAGIDLRDLYKEFPEINRYTKVGPNVPYFPPLSKKLADNTVKSFNLKKDGKVDYNIVGLEKHGIIAIGSTPWEAFEHMERLEHCCEIILKSKV